MAIWLLIVISKQRDAVGNVGADAVGCKKAQAEEGDTVELGDKTRRVVAIRPSTPSLAVQNKRGGLLRFFEPARS